jgi:hypothetical protein
MNKQTRRKAKIALAVLGVVSGVLVLAQRVRELYETSREEYDDAGH